MFALFLSATSELKERNTASALMAWIEGSATGPWCQQGGVAADASVFGVAVDATSWYWRAIAADAGVLEVVKVVAVCAVCHGRAIPAAA